jgi:hypothetical protein
MGRSNLAVLPGACETLQEGLEIGVPARQDMHRFTGGQPREMMLHRPNLIEQLQWIQRGQHGAEALFHRFGDLGMRQQPCTRRFRSVIPFVDSSAHPRLFRELEGRLEEIHEEA